MVRLLMTAVVAACVVAGTASDAVAQASPEGMRAILAEQRGAIVTIRYVLKMDAMGDAFGMFGDGGDQEMEVTGVMVDPSGLVLVSNTQMGGMFARFSGMLAGMGGGVPKPTDLKVLVGDDTQGVEARLVVRDTDLDLAWVKIAKAPETPYAAIDLSRHATVGVGDYVYTLGRAAKFYDRVPVITESRVSGTTTKPRDLVLGGSMSALGLPVFDKAGALVGVSTLIMPEEGEGGMEDSLMGMGMEGGFGTIVPAKDVQRATASAKELAAKPAPDGEPAPETRPVMPGGAREPGSTPPGPGGR